MGDSRIHYQITRLVAAHTMRSKCEASTLPFQALPDYTEEIFRPINLLRLVVSKVIMAAQKLPYAS